jgi:hypothetical protein
VLVDEVGDVGVERDVALMNPAHDLLVGNQGEALLD